MAIFLSQKEWKQLAGFQKWTEMLKASDVELGLETCYLITSIKKAPGVGRLY